MGLLILQQTDMKHYIPVLSIAGSDCSGGAGIQADLKTISALGGYAATAITAITVQNTCGVSDIYPIPAEIVKAQIAAVMEDIRPEAVKIGMVNDSAVIRAIAHSIHTYRPRYVILDPVMVSTSGHKLIKDDAIELITSELMPLATLITPNLKEAEVLCGFDIHTVEDMKQAVTWLLQLGSHAVLLKGGHLEGEQMTDILLTADNSALSVFFSPKVESKNTHGTGCTLSSAIATLLAQGESIYEAVNKAKEYVYQGIIHGKNVEIGVGHGPLNHFFNPICMKTRD